MALCSDNSVLSGRLRARLFCSGAHWQACAAPSGERLKRGGEGRKGGGGRSIQDRFGFAPSRPEVPSTGRAPVHQACATASGRFVRRGLGSGGYILLAFHRPQRPEGK